MPFASINNCRIEYEVSGQGKGLVLIHGTGQTAGNTWRQFSRKFADERRIVCPNYSGSGKTEDNNEVLSIPFLAEQVIAAAEHAGLADFDLAGHSLGVCVAMYIAAEYPEKVNRLVLLTGFSSGADTRLQLQFNMWHDLARSNPKALAQMFLFSAFTPAFLAKLTKKEIDDAVEETFSTTNWEGAARQIYLDLHVNVIEQAKKIRQRTLVVGCAQDYIVPAAHSKELANLIANSVYAEIDCGHAVMLEKEAELVKVVREFFQEQH